MRGNARHARDERYELSYFICLYIYMILIDIIYVWTAVQIQGLKVWWLVAGQGLELLLLSFDRLPAYHSCHSLLIWNMIAWYCMTSGWLVELLGEMSGTYAALDPECPSFSSPCPRTTKNLYGHALSQYANACNGMESKQGIQHTSRIKSECSQTNTHTHNNHNIIFTA